MTLNRYTVETSTSQNHTRIDGTCKSKIIIDDEIKIIYLNLSITNEEIYLHLKLKEDFKITATENTITIHNE